jgi:alpha-1,3/alpha-1,6-mannosyltransferase
MIRNSGGAERLVVDAAVGLKERGHQVVMYTSHHDKNHCFEETRDGKVQLPERS